MTKSQTPNPNEIPITPAGRQAGMSNWDLEIGHSLDIGIWLIGNLTG